MQRPDRPGIVAAGLIRGPAAAARNSARATCCSRRWSPAPGVTMKAVATALGVELRSGRVTAEGDLDFRGTLGVAKDAPVGFSDIRLTFEVDADAPQSQLDTLAQAD